MIRPDVRAGLWKWRDILLGLAVAGFGLWWLATFFSPLRWLGYVFAGLGVMLAIGGWQRMRFHVDGHGPGVVKIVERRLAYFGPLTGGVMEMDDAIKLELEPQALPAPHWVLTGDAGQTLEIPVNSDGADALFDLFASLPGIQTEAMLRMLDHRPNARVVVWQRTRPLLH